MSNFFVLFTISSFYYSAGVTKCMDWWLIKGSPVGGVLTGLGLFGGGERGIRPPGGVTLNGFQDRRNRPLCHLSLRITGAKVCVLF